MSMLTENTTLRRTCEVAGILTVPTFAFLLGRYSEVFSGNAIEWFTVGCFALALMFVLYLQIREKI
jgi:hypothetical protein